MKYCLCFFLLLFICLDFDVSVGQPQNSPLSCGMRDDSLPEAVRETLRKLPSMMAARSQRSGAAGMRICRIALDIDSYTWQQSGYDSLSLIKTLHETMSANSAHFEEQVSIRLVISHVTIFKDPSTDPYRNATGAYSYYMALRDLPPPPVPFDKRMVLFTKPTSEYAGWAPYGQGLSSSVLDDSPTIMHELGHSFGSPHTHSCDWPGGPIDYCSPLEGGPCYDGSLEVRSRPSSLMSYCAPVNNIHPLCQAVMEEHAEKNFQGMTSVPSTVVLPKRATVSQALYVAWAASQQALTYEVMYAASEDFQGGQTIETRVNGISIQKLNAGMRFFLRVRGKNEHGASDWSNPMLVDVSQPILHSPVLRKPAHNSIVTGPQRLEFEPVAGATGYEVHLTTVADTKFSSFIKETTPNTFFDFNPFFDSFRWRVRAIFGEVPGSWSEVRLFSHNASVGNGLTLPFDPVADTAPLSFPFQYQPPRFNTVVSVAVSEKPDMADPLFEKTYQQSTNQFSDWIGELPANRQLYFRIREINPDNERLPQGVIVDFTFGFKTGTARPDPRIHFMTRYSPAIFGKNPFNLALSANHVWFRSYNTGYIQLSVNDLSYKVHHRENTNGLIGVSRLDASLYGDRSGNITFFNDGVNGSHRLIRLGGETVSQAAKVDKFVTLRSFFGFNPEGDICWNSKQICQLRHNELDKVLFEAVGNAFIFDVRVDGDRIRFILINNDQQRHEIVTIDLDGIELGRYHAGKNGSLKDQFRQIAVDSTGEMWVRQQAADGSTSVVGIKGDRFRLFEAKYILAPGQKITSLFASPQNRVYIVASGNLTQVYRLEDSGNWKKIGPELPYPALGDQLWVDRFENFWLSTVYGLVYVKSGDPVLSVDPEPSPALMLFPNPVTDKLRIEYAKAGNKPNRFYIIDLLGRDIGSYLLTGPQSEIDIRVLPPGVYFIRTEADGQVAVGRFVKN